MIGRPTRLTESELDRTLGRWFVGGQETVPTAVVRAALDEIVTTRQQRPLRDRLVIPRASGWRPAALSAGLTLAVVLGVVVAGPTLVGIGPAPTASPSVTASPSTAPSTEPSLSLTSPTETAFASATDGYTLTLPGAWQAATTRWQVTQRYVDPVADRSLTIDVGESVLDGGVIGTCAIQTPAHSACADLTIGYSIPYDAARSFENLETALEGFLDRCDGTCPFIRSDTKLGPDPAVRLELTIDDRRLTYVAAMHGYRPVILVLDEPSATTDVDVLDTIRTAFAYVGEDPTATPSIDVDPFSPQPFLNEVAGYEVSLPQSMTSGTVPDENVILDGIAILAGDREGRLQVCGAYLWACGDDPITTLEELGAVVVAAPQGMIPQGMSVTESHSDTTLGGEPARIESAITPRGLLLGPPAWYVVYAIHDGRPYVIVVDHWRMRRGEIDTSFVNNVVASFRFLD